jgi:hypothetical protein
MTPGARRRAFARAILAWLLIGACGCGSGRAPGEAPAPGRSAAAASVAPGPASMFVDSTRAAGITFVHSQSRNGLVNFLPETLGPGVACLDYDNDGREDLFFVQGSGPTDGKDRSTVPASHLYRQGERTTFDEVGERAGADARGWGQAALALDWNNDGYQDLVITGYRDPVKLLANNGDGTFRTVEGSAGLPAGDRWWSFATAIDHDRDGLQDLYLGAYLRFGPEHWVERPKVLDYGFGVLPETMVPAPYRPEPNAFLRNRGDGSFQDRTAALGVADRPGRALGAISADLDGDHWSDLFVANDVSPCALFRNTGGRFREIAAEAWVNQSRGSMGLALGDHDRDGFPDIVCTHWVGDIPALYVNKRKRSRHLSFTDDAEHRGLGQVPRNLVGWAVSFLDFTNDGRDDLLIIHGHTSHDPRRPGHLEPQPGAMFSAGPDLAFRMHIDRGDGEPVHQRIVGRGAAFVDLDSDGATDVAVGANNGPARLWMHARTGGRWIGLDLAGSRSNRDALGTHVRLSGGATGSRIDRVRQVASGESFFSTNSRRLLFGLGDMIGPCRAEVTWPSGRRESFSALATGRYHRVVEGCGEPAL